MKRTCLNIRERGKQGQTCAAAPAAPADQVVYCILPRQALIKFLPDEGASRKVVETPRKAAAGAGGKGFFASLRMTKGKTGT